MEICRTQHAHSLILLCVVGGNIPIYCEMYHWNAEHIPHSSWNKIPSTANSILCLLLEVIYNHKQWPLYVYIRIPHYVATPSGGMARNQQWVPHCGEWKYRSGWCELLVPPCWIIAGQQLITHGGWDKMTAILKMICPNAFSWLKISVFW